MKDNREFRSFIILENSYPIGTELIKLTQSKEAFEYNNEKVIVQSHSEDDLEDFLDYEFLWETKREITSESLDADTGEVLYEIDYIKKVAQISVWISNDSPYFVVFLKGIAANKVINLLRDYFECPTLHRIAFKDDFFNMLLNSNLPINVLQTTIKSASTEQEFSISGLLNKNNYSLNDGYITEIQIEVPSIMIKAKLSNLGRVALYNAPHKESVIEFTKILGDILVQIEKMRRNY
ncbi:hypothetical protein [Peribacillus frigoritolerans]|uniref:hypothetical protein n=1 Tax=Peribacillus frigoritolerans TaxID=450367 RepID=UPI002E1CEB7A|nr:hypothetical protein [Peribacillus frigoritolerans]MED3848855.1 hypothetical protein [Peribacillus frigoritolerans]